VIAMVLAHGQVHCLCKERTQVLPCSLTTLLGRPSRLVSVHSCAHGVTAAGVLACGQGCGRLDVLCFGQTRVW
jgi:hypothetical protein